MPVESMLCLVPCDCEVELLILSVVGQTEDAL